MKKTKQILSILLAVAMIALSLPFAGAVSDETEFTASGTCGDNTIWTFENGTLTISGTGPALFGWQTRIGMNGESEYYIPLFDALITKFLEKKGVYNQVYEFYLKNNFTFYEAVDLYIKGHGCLFDRNIFYELWSMIDTVIVEEGVTHLSLLSVLDAGYIYGICNPRVVSLPSSLESASLGALTAEKIIFANSEFDFTNSSVKVPCFTSEKIVEFSANEMLAYWAEAVSELYAYEAVDSLVGVLEDVESEYTSIYTYREELENALASPDNDEKAKEEIREELVNLANYEEDILDELSMYLDLNGIKAETIEDVYLQLLALINEALGTDFNSFYEIMVEVPGDNGGTVLIPSEEFEEKYNELVHTLKDYTDESEDGGFLDLGKPYEAQDGQDTQTVPFIAPWTTVYGYSGSTAQTAAETTGVKFQSLEEEDFEAFKARSFLIVEFLAKDGDSNACKKLITDAIDAIAKVKYDNSKTPEENEAVVDAIISKVISDLSEQRKADKPTKTDPQVIEENKAPKLNFFQRIIQWFKNLFAKLFGR